MNLAESPRSPKNSGVRVTTSNRRIKVSRPVAVSNPLPNQSGFPESGKSYDGSTSPSASASASASASESEKGRSLDGYHDLTSSGGCERSNESKSIFGSLSPGVQRRPIFRKSYSSSARLKIGVGAAGFPRYTKRNSNPSDSLRDSGESSHGSDISALVGEYDNAIKELLELEGGNQIFDVF